jgi:3-deoxy-manno-octulosonate cytidylyltransferase (CMP-KDO synthetase)
MKVIGLIPARFASTRFPGKPLALLGGKPMIQWTYEQTCRAKTLDDVYVCTDDVRIQEAVVGFGGKVIMTTSNCDTGSDRCWQALQSIEKSSKIKYNIIANIQGDEPLVDPKNIDIMVNSLTKALKSSNIKMCALATPITTKEDALNRAIAKVTIDRIQRMENIIQKLHIIGIVECMHMNMIS